MKPPDAWKESVLRFYRKKALPFLARIRGVHLIYALSFFLLLWFITSFSIRYLNPFQLGATFYFYDAAKSRWIPENRLLQVTPFESRRMRAERILENALQGPRKITARRSGHPEVRLGSVLIDGQTLVISLSRWVYVDLDPVAEKNLIGSILLAVKANLKAIHEVRFLFGAQEVPFLKGAFDYSRPIDLRGLSLDSPFDKMLE